MHSAYIPMYNQYKFTSGQQSVTMNINKAASPDQLCLVKVLIIQYSTYSIILQLQLDL